MADRTTIHARSTGLVVKDVGDEVVVFDAHTNEAHLLNETLTAVWRRCADGATRTDLRVVLAGRIGVDDVLDDALDAALADLDRAGLLAPESGRSFEVGALTRRSLLKKAGIAAIALPAITTILAPPAAATHTGVACLAPGQSCSQSTDPHTVQCCSGSTCSSTGSGVRCCNRSLGQACSTTTDFCCTGTCTGGACCNSVGGACTSGQHNQCCGADVCNSSGVCTTCTAKNLVPPNGDATMCCSGSLKPNSTECAA